VTDWEVVFDPDADCLTVREANPVPSAGRDLVPCRSHLELLIEYGDTHRLAGLQVTNFSTSGRADLDLELISRIADIKLARALDEARVAVTSSVAEPDFFLRVDGLAQPNELQTVALLSYLRNCVSAYGWVPQPREDVMRYPLPTDEIYRSSDVPNELLTEMNRVLGRVIEEGTSGRASAALKRTRSPGPTSINIIPSDETSACSPLLLTLCFDNDDLGERVNDAVKHAGIHCPQTRAVVLVTSKWDPKKWSQLERDVMALASAFFVYLIGPEGAVARVR